MPTVAQADVRFRPAVRDSSRYRARAVSAPAAAKMATAELSGMRRRAASAGWAADSARRVGGATTATRPKPSTIAAITASATAVHGVPCCHPPALPDGARAPPGMCVFLGEGPDRPPCGFGVPLTIRLGPELEQ